jgi:cell division protein FtsQ
VDPERVTGEQMTGEQVTGEQVTGGWLLPPARPTAHPAYAETASSPARAFDERAWLTMDPRIRERRQAVIHEVTRRRRLLASAVLAVISAAVLALLAVHSALVGVRHLRIRGAVHTDLGLVTRTAGLDSSTPMVDVNGSAIAARLLRLPWVGTVRVTREWPATVRIQISERTPVAFAPTGIQAGPAHWAVVDQTGRVLAMSNEPPTGLLRLTGVAPAGRPGTQLDSEADAALSVAASLPPDLVSRLATVGPATGRRDDPDTALTLRGSGVVLWGTPDDAADKTVALRTVLTRVDLTRVATIDVRVPQAPTVRRS